MRFYTGSDGLSSNEIWSLAEDRAGHIYAGTARGVDRIDPASGRITRYSVMDGLAPGDIRGALSDRDGSLWFLSNRGLSRFDPVERPQQRAPEVRITGLRVAGSPQPLSEFGEATIGPMKFPSSSNSIQIDYSALDYRSMEQVLYQFQLENSIAKWSEPAPVTTVHFANLAPGRYRFLVRAIGSEGVVSPVPASVIFAIIPPVWRQWWFLFASVVAFGAVGYFWLRSRLNRKLAIERVRSRIATDLHDDIGASLARITVMSEMLKTQIGASEAGPQNTLTEIADTSRTLVEGMSDIVWSLDPRRDTLGDVVGRLRAFGSDILEPLGIQWTFLAPDDAVRQKLSPDQRRQLYLIFKEAIHNIARHSQATAAVLRMGQDGHQLWAEIEDNGRGYSHFGETGLGVRSMRSRAEQLGGIFNITARPEGGTRVTLQCPLALTSRKA